MAFWMGILLYIDAMSCPLDQFNGNFKGIAEGVVDKVDLEKRIAVVKVGRVLEGRSEFTHVRLNIGAGPGWHPEALMSHWVKGAPVVLWYYWGEGPKAGVYLNRFFLEFYLNPNDGPQEPGNPWWHLNALATLYNRTYNGTVEELVPLLEKLLAGQAKAPRVSGYLEVPRSGVYNFTLVSNDGARLRIGGTEVVDNDHFKGVVESGGEIALKAGPHALRLDYFQHGGFQVLEVLWEGPDLPWQPIPPSALGREAR